MIFVASQTTVARLVGPVATSAISPCLIRHTTTVMVYARGLLVRAFLVEQMAGRATLAAIQQSQMRAVNKWPG